MQADFEYHTVTDAEYAELHDRYAPLTDAVRGLVQASLRTGADTETMRDAVTAIRAVTESLDARRREHPRLCHEATGRPVLWSNPVVGVRNPLAPPLVISRAEDGRHRSEFTLGPIYEGPPGLVHGGVCAMVLDQLLGEVATNGLSEPKFTGAISLRYLRGTPLGPLRAEAWVDRVDGHKTYARGFIGDAAGPTVEADGVFITPAWARDSHRSTP